MKKQIKLTEDTLREMVANTVKHVLKEYNGSDAIEDYENGLGDLENGRSFSDDDSLEEGFDRNSQIFEICAGRFEDPEDLDIWLSELGELLSMEDELDEIRERLKSMYGYESEINLYR